MFVKHFAHYLVLGKHSQMFCLVISNFDYDNYNNSKRLLVKSNRKKANNPFKKWARDLNRCFNKEDMRMGNKHMERCSITYVIREMQIETTMTYRYTPIRMTKIWNTDNIK